MPAVWFRIAMQALRRQALAEHRLSAPGCDVPLTRAHGLVAAEDREGVRRTRPHDRHPRDVEDRTPDQGRPLCVQPCAGVAGRHFPKDSGQSVRTDRVLGPGPSRSWPESRPVHLREFSQNSDTRRCFGGNATKRKRVRMELSLHPHPEQADRVGQRCQPKPIRSVLDVLLTQNL